MTETSMDPINKMDDLESLAFQIVTISNLSTLDPMLLTQRLLWLGDVDETFVSTLQSLQSHNPHASPSTICRMLAAILPSKCPLSVIVHALLHSGQFNFLASLANTLVRLAQSAPKRRLPRSHPGNTGNSKHIYKHLTNSYNEARFDDPKKVFARLTEAFRSNLANETDERMQEIKAYECLAVWSAGIDYATMMSDPELQSLRLFDDALAIAKCVKNVQVFQGMYYARMATVYAFARDFDVSRDFINLSITCADNIGACFEVSFMYYHLLYALMIRFGCNPSNELLQEILQMADIGMQYLEEEDEVTRNTYKQKFLVRASFCLLGLHRLCKPIPSYEVPKPNIDTAKRHLMEFDRRSHTGVEKRRKVLHLVANARVKELENDVDSAKDSIYKAEQHAREAKFIELENIKDYHRCLNTSHLQG